MPLVPEGEVIAEASRESISTEGGTLQTACPSNPTSTPTRTSGRPTSPTTPLATGFTVADMKPASFTAEELLATAGPPGVGRVNLIQMSYYEFDNRYMLDMIKLYPERFVGTAIVDPLGADPARRCGSCCPGACAPSGSSRSTASCRRPAGSSRRATTRCSPTAAETGQASELPDRPRRLPRGRPDVPAVSRDRRSSSTTSAGSASTDDRSASRRRRALRPGAAPEGATSRSAPSTPWARRRRPTSTSAPLIQPRRPGLRRQRAACGRATARSRSSTTATPTASP